MSTKNGTGCFINLIYCYGLKAGKTFFAVMRKTVFAAAELFMQNYAIFAKRPPSFRA